MSKTQTLIVMAVLAASTLSVHAGQLDLTISGFANDAGLARIILMKDEAGYRGETVPSNITSIPINNRKADWSFKDLEPGTYALIAHHDTNSNNELDRPVFSLPLEPYGYSNGAWTSAGLPSWKDVAFEIANIPTKQSVHIRMNAFAALGQTAAIGFPSLALILAGLMFWRRKRTAISNFFGGQ